MKTPPKIRVLHAVDRLETGGVETQLIRILQEYDRDRFHMDVCLIGGEPGCLAEEARELGASLSSCRKSPNLFDFSLRFRRTISESRYHVVHSHFETWSGPLLRAARQADVPVRIAHLHGRRAWDYDTAVSLPKKLALETVAVWGRRWLCQNATDILAVSQAVLNARKLPCGERHIRYMLWTGGVNIERFSPAERDTSINEVNPIIMWVGSLRPLKRIDLQLRILRRVLEKIPDARLRVVGAGEEETALRSLAAKLGVEDSVELLGLRTDVPDLLRSASIFLSCSETEGLPTALLEAQASGLPVVASDIEPHREALAPELHRYLFTCAETAKAVDGIVELLVNERLRLDLGRSARSFVCDRYNATKQLDGLQGLYERYAGV